VTRDEWQTCQRRLRVVWPAHVLDEHDCTHLWVAETDALDVEQAIKALARLQPDQPPSMRELEEATANARYARRGYVPAPPMPADQVAARRAAARRWATVGRALFKERPGSPLRQMFNRPTGPAHEQLAAAEALLAGGEAPSADVVQLRTPHPDFTPAPSKGGAS
jgi:hypothetical protein